MPDPNDIINRADQTLARVRASQTGRRISQGAKRAKRAVKYSFVGMTLVVLAAFIWGLFVPLGITGAMLTVLAMMGAVLAAVMLSRDPVVRREQLPQAPLAALPNRTAQWLDQQRPLLPAPARTLADGIGVKLEQLAPQLATLDEREPAAAEVRRLIADELPELVRGYERVPPAMRRDNRDGLAPERQLVDGLAVVDQELTRMSEQLARGDLEKLATQGKYLELKYRGGVE